MFLHACLLYLSIAFLPLTTARPYQHSDFHNLNHHLQRHVHQRHSSHNPAPTSSHQRPLLDENLTRECRNVTPELNVSTALVSISFQSIPQWPKSGEEVDVVIIPLGRWIGPDNVSALPRRPHKAELIAARYQLEPGATSRLYDHPDQISCHVYAEESGPKEGDETSKPSPKPFTFRFADREVNFEDPVGPWFLGGRSIARFGCF
ncbi:hypothetical protein MMC32_008248 [Xylographa parallela]|nr:hypothetical protein [Xylographa parallela]